LILLGFFVFVYTFSVNAFHSFVWALAPCLTD